jgi:hypothetical protein
LRGGDGSGQLRTFHILRRGDGSRQPLTRLLIGSGQPLSGFLLGRGHGVGNPGIGPPLGGRKGVSQPRGGLPFGCHMGLGSGEGGCGGALSFDRQRQLASQRRERSLRLTAKTISDRLERLLKLLVECQFCADPIRVELWGSPSKQVKQSKPNNSNGHSHLTTSEGAGTIAE